MSEEKKIVTMEELAKHKDHENLWLLIDGKVYDVSKFMDEHPGGDEVLISEAGKDATEAFEDVGHSDDARSLLGPMFVGEIEGGAVSVKQKTAVSTGPAAQGSSNPIFMFLPLILLGAYVAYRYVA
ncbi:putative cytochrome b5 [Violaceomyces palustris]|uniref:Cytochrome b5 n=1 Tax=Violaceomyces palustris TaxID=1673888 RepID=A0ACD0P661_9BASI|nr:putative cytochrome b5 [Violaceomyces palustris]